MDVKRREFRWALGQRIKLARDNAGLDQTQLAVKLGLSQSTMARMELGQIDISAWRLAQIASETGFELRKLLPPAD